MLGAVWAHPGTEEGLCWPEESTSYMENGSTATGPLHCPHSVSPLPFPSSLPAPKSGHKELQKSRPVLSSDEFMLSSSEERRSEYFALTASQHSLYMEGKTAWKDSKDRNARCSFLSVLFLQTFHALSMSCHACASRAGCPGCSVTAAPAFNNNNQVMIFEGCQEYT